MYCALPLQHGQFFLEYLQNTSHQLTHERERCSVYCSTYPIARRPGASKTTSQASGLEQSLFFYNLCKQIAKMQNFGSWASQFFFVNVKPRCVAYQYKLLFVDLCSSHWYCQSGFPAICDCVVKRPDCINTLGWDKMAAILQTTFSNEFSWMKMYYFRLKFHWSLFPRVQLTIFQHWFR